MTKKVGYRTLVLVAMLWACSAGWADGKKVLLLPVCVISHARQMMMVGEALVDRGHDVYAVFSPKTNGLHLFQGGKVIHNYFYFDWQFILLASDASDF